MVKYFGKRKVGLLVVYRGVFVSLNPRNTPCMAKERRTAGAPSDLKVKYCSAGVSIGEPYLDKIPIIIVQ